MGVTGANFVIILEDELFTNSLKDFEDGDILLAKFAPILRQFL